MGDVNDHISLHICIKFSRIKKNYFPKGNTLYYISIFCEIGLES